MSQHKHYGIRCSVADGALCVAIGTCLSRIKRVAPADYRRLMLLVQAFEPVPPAESERGTRGAWISEPYNFDATGTIQLLPGIEYPLATVAHELGHACTVEREFERLDGFDSEWASEMCADRCAYRWGFGREIARARPTREFGHHGPGPGQIFTLGPGEFPDWPDREVVYRFRVTRAFHIRLIQIETPEGTLLETAEQVRARRKREVEERLRKAGLPVN